MCNIFGARLPASNSPRANALQIAVALMIGHFLFFTLAAFGQADARGLNKIKEAMIGQWKTNLGESESWTLEFRQSDLVWRGGDEIVAEGASWELREVAGSNTAIEVVLHGESPDEHSMIVVFEAADRILCPLPDGTQAVFNRLGGSAMLNSGFEQPPVGEEIFEFVKLLPGWQTTDTEFEVWGTGFMGFKAYEGNQFVELNANQDGTLFQVQSGIEQGATIQFSFAHRGRNGEDTMQFTLTDLGADNAFGGGDDTTLFQKQYTTGTEDWAVYNSTSEPAIAALGNSVRFAYTAVHGTGGAGPDKSEGNFLDAANFGVGVVSKRNVVRRYPLLPIMDLAEFHCEQVDGMVTNKRPELPTKFIVETYGVHGRGNADQPKYFIGVAGDQLKIVPATLANALKNEDGVQTITREKLDGGLVALKIGDRYVPDFAATIGDANRYREVAPVFPPEAGEKDFISLESANTPGVYLRHSSYRVFNGDNRLNHPEDVFRQDVTWHFHEVPSGSSGIVGRWLGGETVTIEFKSGNVFVVTTPEVNTQGTYKLEGSQLTMTQDGGESEVSAVEFVNSNTITLNGELELKRIQEPEHSGLSVADLKTQGGVLRYKGVWDWAYENTSSFELDLNQKELKYIYINDVYTLPYTLVDNEKGNAVLEFNLPDGAQSQFEWTDRVAVKGKFWLKGVAKTEKPITQTTMRPVNEQADR